MPWWAFLYCLLLLWIWGSATIGDFQDKERPFWIIVDAVTMIAWLFLIVAYFHPRIVMPFGRWVVLISLLGLVGTGFSVEHDLSTLPTDERFSWRANTVINALSGPTTVVLLAPAVAFGVLVALRAF